MRDTWIGSGVLSKDVFMYFDCDNCGTAQALEGQTDDGGHMAYATCPNCKASLEQYIWGSEEDDDFWEE